MKSQLFYQSLLLAACLVSIKAKGFDLKKLFLQSSDLLDLDSNLPQNVQTNLKEMAKKATPKGDIQPLDFRSDNIQYYLYTKNNPNDSQQLDSSSCRSLNSRRQVVLFLHGWTQNHTTLWYKQLKDAFFQRTSYVVVEVDWSYYADRDYVTASNSTTAVGYYIGDYTIGLMKNCKIPISNILVVGHSLGGQVAGFVGKRVKKVLKESLPRIIALDPAGPLFSNRPTDNRLNSRDATHVHVIHTSAGILGFPSSCGTIDFWPNGGTSQDGCPNRVIEQLLSFSSLSDVVFCDHHRSYKYFIEGVNIKSKFVSKKCRKFYSFKVCTTVTASLGDLNVTKKGNFFLDTHSKSPFSKE